MTPSLQEAFLDHRGRTYGRVRVISASSWGRLGDILPRCGAILKKPRENACFGLLEAPGGSKNLVKMHVWGFLGPLDLKKPRENACFGLLGRSWTQKT